MRDVWKFAVPINWIMRSTLRIPVGAKTLHVREQGDSIAIWCEVDTTAVLEDRKFQIFGTGTGPIRDGLEYVGTGIFADGSLVLHLYEIKED